MLVSPVSALGRLIWCLALTEATPWFQVPLGAVALPESVEPAGKAGLVVKAKLLQVESPSLANEPV